MPILRETPPAQAIIEAICADKQPLSIKSISVTTYPGEMEVTLSSKDLDVVRRVLRVLRELSAQDDLPLECVSLGYQRKT